jgi:hypothetical protein
MLIPTPRFLALPLIALAIIMALGLQGQRAVPGNDVVSVVAPLQQQLAQAAKFTVLR